MRWLINYIRSCFCKHEFVTEEANYTKDYYDDWGKKFTSKNVKVSMICNKCAYHKKFNKY